LSPPLTYIVEEGSEGVHCSSSTPHPHLLRHEEVDVARSDCAREVERRDKMDERRGETRRMREEERREE
jgi:hypothetical protein